MNERLHPGGYHGSRILVEPDRLRPGRSGWYRDYRNRLPVDYWFLSHGIMPSKQKFKREDVVRLLLAMRDDSAWMVSQLAAQYAGIEFRRRCVPGKADAALEWAFKAILPLVGAWFVEDFPRTRGDLCKVPKVCRKTSAELEVDRILRMKQARRRSLKAMKKRLGKSVIARKRDRPQKGVEGEGAKGRRVTAPGTL